MSEELFQSVLNEPENVDVRLVYADWLEERGDSRAEFIRLQLALSAVTDAQQGFGTGECRQPANSDWENLADWVEQMRRLLQRNRRQWNAALHKRLVGTPLQSRVGRRQPIRRWAYRRGFVEDLRVEAPALKAHFSSLFQLGPITRLYVANVQDLLPNLIAIEPLNQLKEVTFELNGPYRDSYRESLSMLCREHPQLTVRLTGPLYFPIPELIVLE